MGWKGKEQEVIEYGERTLPSQKAKRTSAASRTCSRIAGTRARARLAAGVIVDRLGDGLTMDTTTSKLQSCAPMLAIIQLQHIYHKYSPPPSPSMNARRREQSVYADRHRERVPSMAKCKVLVWLHHTLIASFTCLPPSFFSTRPFFLALSQFPSFPLKFHLGIGKAKA